MVQTAHRLKVGNPLDKDCDVGPMISESEAIRAEEWIREAVAGGAKLLAGGSRRKSILEPTVLIGVRADMDVVRKEVFAPIVFIIEYGDFEEALRMADDSPFGLQAGVYTRDISKAMRAIERLNVGGLLINDTSIFRADHMPYGGNKMSGLGREGVRYAINEMTNINMVVMRA